MIPTCKWRRNNTQPGAEEENWVVKQAGLIMARQQSPVLKQAGLIIVRQQSPVVKQAGLIIERQQSPVVKQAGLIMARQQSPVVLLESDLKMEWIAFKSIYACLHVAVQQIQDVLAVSQCPIFFSYPVRPLVSKGLYVANFFTSLVCFWFRQYFRLYYREEYNNC